MVRITQSQFFDFLKLLQISQGSRCCRMIFLESLNPAFDSFIEKYFLRNLCSTFFYIILIATSFCLRKYFTLTACCRNVSRSLPFVLINPIKLPVLPSYRNQSTDLLSKSIDWFLNEGNTGI